MCFDSALFFIFGSVLFCSGFFFLLLLLLLFNNPVSNCIHRFYTSILNETKERGIYFECISAGCWMFAAVSSMNLGSLDRHFSNIVYRYELLSWALTCLLFQIPASGICSSDGNSVVVFLFSLVPSKSHFQMGTFGADFHEMVKKTEQKKQKKNDSVDWAPVRVGALITLTLKMNLSGGRNALKWRRCAAFAHFQTAKCCKCFALIFGQWFRKKTKKNQPVD